MYYVYVAGYILLAAAMQLFTGNFPVSFLAFPLNIIFAAPASMTDRVSRASSN